MDWKAFVERQSVVEAVLRDDPGGAYARMTFATRDRYRHVVERIAKRTGRDEAAVAGLARELARAASSGDATDPRRVHVGYYLVDDGLVEIRSEEHTSELQSPYHISYAVFCLDRKSVV